MDQEALFEQKRKYWEQMRNAIVHEDNLVNHRLTWTLSIEGFLVAGFFLVQNSVLSGNLSPRRTLAIEALLVLVFVGALCICFISGSMIAAAYRQITFIRNAWRKRYPEERREPQPLPQWFWRSGALPEDDTGSTQAEFPPLMGEFRYSFLASSQRIPAILFSINCIAIAGCLLITCVAMMSPGQQP
jgi:hypothetical protein